MTRDTEPTRRPRERVVVCGVILPGQGEEHDGPLSEARGLAAAAGTEVVGEGIVQRRPHADPATLMGRGKVEEVAFAVRRLGADAVVVDNDLKPAQVRNLERAWGVRVVDRAELIMDIFARRAQTRQAMLQVELAQMEYLLPRLRRMWPHLERTEGAIGTRGPGETQLETDRRLIRKRIRDLRARLSEIEKRKQRQVRSRSDQYTVGLVGYTNAGKSTLLNQLPGAGVLAEDMLFATLDTRTRKWRLADGRVVLLVDTVGFLRRLPHHLLASFHATLEEALNVDLLLHVVDASHPDAALQIEAANRVLAELSRHRPADVLVLNKVDRVPDPIRLHLLPRGPIADVVRVSARSGEGLDLLEDLVARHLDRRSALVEVRVPMSAGGTRAAVRALGAVESEEVLGDQAVVLRARILEGALGNLRRGAEPGVVFRVLEPASEPLLQLDDDDEPAGPALEGDEDVERAKGA